MNLKNQLCSLNYGNSIISKTQCIKYIGPRAIFDQNFVPEVLIPRKKKSKLICGIITDAIEDDYSTNINLFGLKGTGKKLIINHFMQWLADEQKKIQYENGYEYKYENKTENITKNKTENKTENKNKNRNIQKNSNYEFIKFIQIDCSQKDIEQILLSIFAKIGKILNLKLNFKEILQYCIAKLWNSLRFLIEKVDHIIILNLQKIESINSRFLNKIYNLSKNNRNLLILTSLNTGLQNYRFKNYNGMDHRIRLDDFNITELQKIIKDRSIMTFKNLIDKEILDMIIDYISEFDFKVPGSCINYLKQVYHIKQQKGNIIPEDLREISQMHFDRFNIDSISLTDFVMNTTIEERLFLDYLVNFFKNQKYFYIPFNEIKKAYMMTAEEIGFVPKKNEFYNSFRKVTSSQIIRPSPICIAKEKRKFNGIYKIPHFLTLPVEEINEIMEYSFGLVDNRLEDMEF